MSEKNVTFFGNVKLVVASILGVILLLFALQNMARVDLTYLFWTFEARRVVVIVMSFVIGIGTTSYRTAQCPSGGLVAGCRSRCK